MTDEEQHDLVDALGDCLRDSGLPLPKLLEPLLYMLADVMSQMTDREADDEFGKDVAKMLLRCYVFHCTFDEVKDCHIQ